MVLAVAVSCRVQKKVAGSIFWSSRRLLCARSYVKRPHDHQGRTYNFDKMKFLISVPDLPDPYRDPDQDPGLLCLTGDLKKEWPLKYWWYRNFFI
jgi:hypothetical protein